MKTLLLLLPVVMLSAQTAPAPAIRTVKTTTLPARTAAVTNYKESGSPTAAVTIEAYTDYECPHCALFFKNFMPQFTADYIKTGKVKFVHRDFPLPMHPHAQLAARFANAAGELGFYDQAVDQIFKTQEIWGVSMNGNGTGNIDEQLAKVIPPGAMQKIRELVKADPRIDESMKVDLDWAMNRDHVPSTPTIVVVSKGKREPISSIMETPYSIFKKYLDAKIAGQ